MATIYDFKAFFKHDKLISTASLNDIVIKATNLIKQPIEKNKIS